MSSSENNRLPEYKTFQEASKLALVEDKPILLDYWLGSIDKSVLIGVTQTIVDDKEVKESVLVRSEDEYTSPIAKIFKSGNEYIIMTENSIYIVDAEIPKKRIDRST